VVKATLLYDAAGRRVAKTMAAGRSDHYGSYFRTMGLTSQVISPNIHVTKYAYHSAPDSVRGLLKAVTELSVPVWDSVSRIEFTDSLRAQRSSK
jgi:hypothetical protein